MKKKHTSLKKEASPSFAEDAAAYRHRAPVAAASRTPTASYSKVTASEFAKNFGAYRERALRRPVAVTSHGRTAGYFISPEDFEEYQLLRRRRRAYKVEELPENTIRAMAKSKMDKKHDHLNKLLDDWTVVADGTSQSENPVLWSYSYLWSHEFHEGREEEAKDRPAVIVVAVEVEHPDTRFVTVTPITHSRPKNPSDGVELPARVKENLGLDHAPAWIILNEANRFEWPGPDLRPIPHTNPRRYDYGFIPPRLYNKVLREFMARWSAGTGKPIPR